jgi:1,4-alpha-glucan branching enzyme
MGNEFGHPEWIDFPREGNGWSYHYCRRQWSLADDTTLRYGGLNEFDKDMVCLLKGNKLLEVPAINRWMLQKDKILIYTKGDFVFVFNFHPERSFEGYFVPVGEAGEYKVVLSSDEEKYGGFSRVNMEQKYEAKETPDGWFGFQCYLPSRSAIVLKKEPKKAVKKKVVIKKIFKK